MNGTDGEINGSPHAVLQDLKEGKKRIKERSQGENLGVSGPSNRATGGEWSHDEEARHWSNQSTRDEVQLGENQGQLNSGGGMNVQEGELRYHLNVVVRERDQVMVQNPYGDIELEGKMRQLAQVIDELPGRQKAPS